ncbi:MAG: hypothetical protein QXW98_06330 [Candidatus Caldarchaeum sp.]
MANKTNTNTNAATEQGAQVSPSEPTPAVENEGGYAEVGFEPLDKHNLLDIEQNAGDKYKYFWAHQNPSHPQNVSAMKRMGYEVVPEGEAKAYFGYNKDGGVVLDELVLMRIPKERAERLAQHRLEQYYRRVRSEEEKLYSVGKGIDGVETEVYEQSAPNAQRRTFYFPNNPLKK